MSYSWGQAPGKWVITKLKHTEGWKVVPPYKTFWGVCEYFPTYEEARCNFIWQTTAPWAVPGEN